MVRAEADSETKSSSHLTERRRTPAHTLWTAGFTLLRPDSSRAGTVRAHRILYGTMTKTDMIVYEVNESYASIRSRLNVTPLTLAQQDPANGAGMAVVSGYWKRIYTCSVQATIPQL